MGETGPGVWITQTFGREDWTGLGDGLWRAPRAAATWYRKAETIAPRLVADGALLGLLGDAHWADLLDAEPEGEERRALLALAKSEGRLPGFCISTSYLYLGIEPGDEPPASASLGSFVSFGAEREGRWRVIMDSVVADGIPALPGSPQAVALDVPPRSVLRLTTATRGRDGLDPVRFRVLLDGDSIFEHSQPCEAEERTRQHAISLPEERRAGAELRFEVDGPLALSAFLTPVVGPADVGRYGDRPTPPRAPDIVLISADTFRADNLEAYGGDAQWAPTLNALATESRAFLESRSSATWTLPSHASMFSGLYPIQAGMRGKQCSLPGKARTIAEHLAEHGYRTAAVTERGFVARAYGMDQGFQWFQEGEVDLEQTLARTRVVLDADDGRPLFLFVHSYRVHAPYVVSDEARAQLGTDDDWAALMDLVNQMPDPEHGPPVTGERAEVLARVERLYRGGVIDFDAGMKELFTDLTSRGVLPSSYLVFTSDHGEAFGEHGLDGHGKGVWEEHVRVPLLISGPGIESGEVTYPVTSLDLPRTISALAGLDPYPRWMGSDLRTLDEVRPQFTYVNGLVHPDYVGCIHGDHKLVWVAARKNPEQLALRFAYDLSTDPAEARDVSTGEATWPEEVEAEVRPLRDAAALPLLSAEAATLEAAHEAELEALGYAGEDEE